MSNCSPRNTRILAIWRAFYGYGSSTWRPADENVRQADRNFPARCHEYKCSIVLARKNTFTNGGTGTRSCSGRKRRSDAYRYNSDTAWPASVVRAAPVTSELLLAGGARALVSSRGAQCSSSSSSSNISIRSSNSST